MDVSYFTILFSFIILCQVGVSIYTRILLEHQQSDDIRDKHETYTDSITSYIQVQLEDNDFINHRNGALISINGPYMSYTNFTNALQSQYDSGAENIEAYEIILRLGRDDIPYFNSFCIEQISEECYLKQPKPGSKITGSPDDFEPVSLNHTDYYALLYLYPLVEIVAYTKTLNGLDMGSFSVGQQILAQFQGLNSSVTRRAVLVVPSSNKNAYGIVLGAPIYSSYDSRIFYGYSTVVIRLSRLIDKAVKNTGIMRSDVDVIMFDITQDGIVDVVSNNVSIIYKENLREYDHIWSYTDVNKYTSTRNLVFVNRQYSFYYVFTDHKDSSVDIKVITIICVFILLDIIIYIIYALYKAQRQKHRAILDRKATSQMLSYCNHEIRNPLNAIKGMVDNTIDCLSTEPVIVKTCISNLSIASSSCEFMEHLVSDVLIMQKLENNTLDLHLCPCNIRDLLNEIVESMTQKIEERKNVTFQVSYLEEDIILRVDPFRFKQIILNFLSNSVKYTIRGFIGIEMLRNKNDLQISVSDTGVGIKDQYKPFIFTPQSTHDEKNIRKYGSFGIGLYLVKILADHMNWEVGFESNVNIGSTFWVKIPFMDDDIP